MTSRVSLADATFLFCFCIPYSFISSFQSLTAYCIRNGPCTLTGSPFGLHPMCHLWFYFLLPSVIFLYERTSGCRLICFSGAVFAQDKSFIARATDSLVDTTGKFYVNVQSTGSVVGQQPFGGARLSGQYYLNLYKLGPHIFISNNLVQTMFPDRCSSSCCACEQRMQRLR